jgi:hypothetical protein
MIEDDKPNPISVENVSGSTTTTEHKLASEDDLLLASDPALTEDLALTLLKRSELPVAVLEQLAKNTNAFKSRKVKLALASHLHTPRHVSIPLVRQFYTFDLMRVTLSPTVPSDVKIVAENTLITRLKSITFGERLTLARRASGRIAAALLLDSKARVAQTALENGRLTEALVIQAVLRPEASAPLVQAVAQHAKWSLRREVCIALLRTEFLPLARALEFSRELPPLLLCDVLSNSQLPAKIKEEILQQSRASSDS